MAACAGSMNAKEITLYRDKGPDFRKAAPGGGPAPVAEAHGPTYALFRDGFIIGRRRKA